MCDRIHQLLTQRFRQCGNGSSEVARGKRIITVALNSGEDPVTAIARWSNNAENRGVIELQRLRVQAAAADSLKDKTGDSVGGFRDIRNKQAELRAAKDGDPEIQSYRSKLIRPLPSKQEMEEIEEYVNQITKTKPADLVITSRSTKNSGWQKNMMIDHKVMVGTQKKVETKDVTPSEADYYGRGMDGRVTAVERVDTSGKYGPAASRTIRVTTENTYPVYKNFRSRQQAIQFAKDNLSLVIESERELTRQREIERR